MTLRIRAAVADDAEGILAIYAPIVSSTVISFETEVPSVAQMRQRIDETTARYPWLVAPGDGGAIDGYVYASRHRERAAYRWAVDTTAYVHPRAQRRGLGRALYGRLFDELVALGHFQAFAGIALPNEASVGLHESVGFDFIGVYQDVGYKLGAWHSVGWWQRRLQSRSTPQEPRAFRAAATGTDP